jgi:hypothetical protein
LKKLCKILLALLLMAAILGCQNNVFENQKDTLKQKKNPRIIVLGIDSTGSYQLWGQAKRISIKIIDDLEPGDIFYFRRITDASYLDSCTIFRLELPFINHKSNPFDRKLKYLQRSQINRIDLLKKEAVKRLNQIKFTNAKNTDIYGFLAAASDRFALAPKSYQKNLIIASDLLDNIRYKVKLNLKDVKVAIIGFQASKDPLKTRKLKEKWAERFSRAGAVKVVFLPIEEIYHKSFFQEAKK